MDDLFGDRRPTDEELAARVRTVLDQLTEITRECALRNMKVCVDRTGDRPFTAVITKRL